MRRLITVICLSIGLAAHAQSAPSNSPSSPDVIIELTPVLVSGVQTGPGLWKVSRNGHVLWIMGTVSPLPKKMQWYAPDVNAAVVSAQELIDPPGISIGLGAGAMVKAMFSMPTLLKARRNPDDKSLSDVLPVDLYARWKSLKQQYLGSDKDIEKWRPVFAADALYAAALKKVGLESGNRVIGQINALADKHKLKHTSSTISAKVTDPRGMAKAFSRSNPDEVACFRSMLDRLERDVATAADTANAWAVGDLVLLDDLRKATRDSCIAVFTENEAIRSLGLENGIQRSRALWLVAVEKALANNSVSFTSYSVGSLLDDDGPLAQLQAKGYEVLAPQ